MAMYCNVFSKLPASFPPSSGRRHKTISQPYSPQSIRLVQLLESLQSRVVGENQSEMKHIDNLVKARDILSQVEEPLESLRTIDSLQRLGIDYHFKEEIENKLGLIRKRSAYTSTDLFQVALSFRLLRQAGHYVSSDVFDKFIDKKGQFDLSLKKDTAGLLSLYEASFLNTGEDILYRAKEFSSEYLRSCMENFRPDVADLVTQSLKNPFHKTLARYNSPYYINQNKGSNRILRDLARMDFNRVQAVYQGELLEILSWWKDIGLAQELSFIRDQPLKWYTWPMAMLPDPQFSKCRIELTKVISFVYIIDDIFDVYGSFEELSLFTKAINKWDLSVVETLPTYMQTCYITLYNTTNEIAQAAYAKHGLNPINYLKESWGRLCNAFLKESKWFRSKRVPNSDEYLKNAVISSGVHTVLLHAYFLSDEQITEGNAKFLESDPSLLSCPAKILRLWDDYGSAKDEKQDGFDGSYVEYLMKEHQDYSMESARDHVMKIISTSWENLNKDCFSSSHFAPNLVTASLNLARMVEVMYSYDNDQNLPILEDYINTLLFKSI
nr:terpene synthase TPS9 [Freesia caryophyllacea]